MHTAFLLAAGLGTRLRPLTAVVPKPLLPVCGVPMLDHALALVRAHGHSSVMVNAHHLWEQVATWAVLRGVEVQVELPEILGTGGGLRAAASRLDPRGAVVVNADVLSDVDLSALAAALPADGCAMALRPSPDAAAIGAVEADPAGVVVHIARVIEGAGGVPGTHFTGVHMVTGAALALVPDPAATGQSCVIRTAYKALIPQRRVAAITHTGTWIDIGTPAAYLQANLDALAGRLALAEDPWRRGTRGPGGSWVGPGAVIEGTVERCVIGAGAVVPAGATLRDCVVWDGLTVPEGAWERAVHYGRGPGPAQVLPVG